MPHTLLPCLSGNGCITCKFPDKTGQIVLDQLPTVDRTRLVKRLGQLQPAEQKAILAVLSELFAE
ncbi:type II toxin-antitoxin system PemK/MazF family toxin [Phormidium tenue FACHB-886]|nr:type II toxin-antitoxin system PemK/MazF family toxin [Phormidium tenue FACHB-886]